MSVLCFGLSHQCAPLALIEAVSFDSEQMAEFLASLCKSDAVREAIGVSTCNRTEFYIAGEQPEEARRELLNCLAATANQSLSLQVEHSYTKVGAAAARHLFRVASGVDSLVIGERQILGQLRGALDTARTAGTCHRVLNKLFTKALHVGRRAHRETQIGRGNISVASIGVNITRKVFSDLTPKRVLVIGAGQTGKLAAMHFRGQGVRSITIANRTMSRAEQLAAAVDGKAVALDDLNGALANADIIVTATNSEEYLLTAEMLKKSRSDFQVLIDLSLPRNIDPAVGDLPMVFLYGIEDLESVADDNRSQREAEVARVEEIVEEEIQRFAHWLVNQDTARAVDSLRRRVETIRLEHMEKQAKRVSPDEAEWLDRYSDSLLRSVLHDLTTNLRSIDMQSETGAEELELARRLLNIPSSVK
ncbi:glutamyl-tRNA reductase [bacterium]|nr:glutamyl-tRNA reductase [bacterium]